MYNSKPESYNKEREQAVRYTNNVIYEKYSILKEFIDIGKETIDKMIYLKI